MKKLLILALALLTAAACSPSKIASKSEPKWSTETDSARRRDISQPVVKSTSLWRSNAELTSVYNDHRARHVGDLVTVIVSETSEASREASTNLGRDSSVSAGISTMLGAPSHLGAPDLWGNGFNFSPNVAASTGNSFKGGGSSKRKESLKSMVAARVMEILPDGNFLVEGRRQVDVNDEVQFLYVKGIARPVDISPYNTISSSALADAEILYDGSGAITSDLKPGWGYRILSAIWPF